MVQHIGYLSAVLLIKASYMSAQRRKLWLDPKKKKKTIVGRRTKSLSHARANQQHITVNDIVLVIQWLLHDQVELVDKEPVSIKVIKI